MRHIFLGIFVLLFCFISADAHVIKGNDLVGWMEEFDKADSHATDFSWYETAYFMGFVMGVYDSHENEFRVNEPVNVRKVTIIVSKYLKEHPEEWNQPAYVLVLNALRSAFPRK